MLQDDTSTFTTGYRPGTVDGTCRFQDFLARCRYGPGWQGRQKRRGIGIVASDGIPVDPAICPGNLGVFSEDVP